MKAERALKNAVESAEKNFTGLGQTKTAGGAAPGSRVIVLVIRPQEVVAAVQTLAQAYNDYYGAVNDYNRAQFRLYRAVGQPAQLLAEQAPDCPGALSNCKVAPPPTGASSALLGDPIEFP
jgi:hypothetical protein